MKLKSAPAQSKASACAEATTDWPIIALRALIALAKFHVALKRGHTYTLRIYVPQRHAGLGYLDGVSRTGRVGGTA